MKKIKEQKTLSSDFISLNGEQMQKIQGGARAKIKSTAGAEDRLCNGGCGATANWVTVSVK